MSKNVQALGSSRVEPDAGSMDATLKMLKGLSGIFLVFASGAAVLLKLLADSHSQPALQHFQLNIFIMGMLVFFGIVCGWFLFWAKEASDAAAEDAKVRWQKNCWKIGKALIGMSFVPLIAIISWGTFSRFEAVSDSLRAFETLTIERMREQEKNREN